jgi:(S)-ureidoglycine-glyoxylate aminotransferase
MGSGPSNAEARVLQALAMPPLGQDAPAVTNVLHNIEGLIGEVFQSSGCHVAVPGASRAGLEAAMVSLVEPGERVLVGVYGHFGELLCSLAARHGAAVERVEAEWGRPVEPEVMLKQIWANPPKLVAIVHADTSTGILQPLSQIGTACREVGSLLLADVVLSIGGCEVNVDGWHIDAAVGGLQKCLGGPPGQALLTLSEPAQRVMATERTAPQSRYLDLSGRLETPTPMLFGAGEALRMVIEEGLQARWARHRQASNALRAGLAAMGLALFGDPGASVPMITLVKVPDGVDEAEVRAQLLDEHAIEIMAAFGPLRGRVWRIGSMGTNACLPSVLAVLGGLEAVLASNGFSLPRGAAVDAALGVSRQRP